MPKQTELEKKTEELAVLRGAKAMSWRRFKLDLQMIHWPALVQCQLTDEREVVLIAELEKLGVDTTQIAAIRDEKWVDKLVSPVGFEPTSPGSEPRILPLDDRETDEVGTQ